MFVLKIRKLIAIYLATFYLILSSGGFACVLTCGATNLLRLVRTQHSSCVGDRPAPAMCTGKKDCPCCKKHANFETRETLRPSALHYLFIRFGVLQQIQHVPVLLASNPIHVVSLMHFFRNKAPTPLLVTPLFIRLLTLLI